MTYGALLNELTSGDPLAVYSTVVVGEYHEGSPDTEMLLGMLKDVLAKNLKLNCIIMSETLNA